MRIRYWVRKTIYSMRYWIAWKLAGKQIWNKATHWAAEHIYLYSAMEKGQLITLPEGITVADEPVILSSGKLFNGDGQILTQAVNKPFDAVIIIPPNCEDAMVQKVVILGHGSENTIKVDEWASKR